MACGFEVVKLTSFLILVMAVYISSLNMSACSTSSTRCSPLLGIIFYCLVLSVSQASLVNLTLIVLTSKCQLLDKV